MITRRGCAVDLWLFVKGLAEDAGAIDASWFYVEATLRATTNEVDTRWNG